MTIKYYSFFIFIMILTPTLSINSAESKTSPAQSSQESSKTYSAPTNAIIFTPPAGWRNADSSALPTHVNLMVVGQGSHELPPSMTLGTEHYKGTLKQYLKRIKEINRSKGYEWKDLGTIHTDAGNASLSQLDSKTEWGDVRMMHVILLRDETIYILTAAALREEFATYYKDVFDSFRSLRFGKSPSNTTAYKPQK